MEGFMDGPHLKKWNNVTPSSGKIATNAIFFTKL